MPYTDFKGRRTKFAPMVGGINLCEAFMPPTAAAVRRVAAPYKVCCNKIVRISRADDIRPYRIVLIYNIVWPSIIDIYTDSSSYGRTNTVAYFNFFSRRMPLYGPSVQVPTGTKPKFS